MGKVLMARATCPWAPGCSMRQLTRHRNATLIPVITLMVIAALLAVEVGWLCRC